jgi:hypothetical protein
MYESEMWQILTDEMNTLPRTVIYFLKTSTDITRLDEVRDVKIREITSVEGKPDTTYNI